jgi:hypothetical protein
VSKALLKSTKHAYNGLEFLSTKSKLAVKQGDNLSPNLFNLYVNDPPSYFDASCDPVTINKTQIHCFMSKIIIQD